MADEFDGGSRTFAGRLIALERTDTALLLTATSRLGQLQIGKTPKAVAYADLLTVEMGRFSIEIRETQFAIIVLFGRSQYEAAQQFVTALLDQHEAVIGRRVGSANRMTASERKEVLSTSVRAGLLARLPFIREAILADDISAEQALVFDLTKWMHSTGSESPSKYVDHALAGLRAELGLPPLVLVGEVGNIRVFEDRVCREEQAHPIDAFTEARVFLDGEVQVRAGEASTGDRTHDNRTASFQIGSTQWTWVTEFSPAKIAKPRGVAQRVNTIATARGAAGSGSPVPEIIGQLERIGELERSGAISAEQANTLKSRLFDAT